MNLGDFGQKKKVFILVNENYDGLSSAVVVEGVLNYGDMNDVRELITLLGIKEVAKIFRENTNRPRINYRPEVKLFPLYFQNMHKKFWPQPN